MTVSATLRTLTAMLIGTLAGVAFGLWLHDLRPVRGHLFGKVYLPC